jgi:hypothetical protein
MRRTGTLSYDRGIHALAFYPVTAQLGLTDEAADDGVKLFQAHIEDLNYARIKVIVP